MRRSLMEETLGDPSQSQNTPVYDPARRAVVLNLLTASSHNAQVVSHDEFDVGPPGVPAPFLGGLDWTGPSLGPAWACA